MRDRPSAPGQRRSHGLVKAVAALPEWAPNTLCSAGYQVPGPEPTCLTEPPCPMSDKHSIGARSHRCSGGPTVGVPYHRVQSQLYGNPSASSR
jgi:hypothetical protein